MASSECCRLCKGDVETVVSVFDKRINENLPAIVQVTTGVEITQRDEISQKLCLTCLQITIKMYKFRKTALKNNEELMTKHAQSKQGVDSKSTKPSADQKVPVKKKTAQPQPSIRVQPKYKNAHPSIKAMLAKYPGLVLPSFSLNSHVSPYITLDKEEIEEYYSDNGVTREEIERQKKIALKAAISFKEPLSGTKRSHDCDSDDQSSKRKCLPQVLPETKKLSKNVTLIRLNPLSASIKIKQVPTDISNSSTREPISNEPIKNGDISCSVTPSFSKPNVVGPSFGKRNVVAKKKTYPSKPVGIETSKNLSSPHSTVLKKDKFDENNRTQEENRSDKLGSCDRMPRLISVLRPSTVEKGVNHVDRDHAYAHSDAGSDSKRYKLRLQRNVIYDDEEQSDCSSTLDANFGPENDDVSSESSATSRSTVSLLDSSLVSHSHKKTRTLFTCKVCDCVLYSKKDLQNHLQRTHTKCPFCSNRFRTTAARDEHVANDCTAKEVNNEPIKLKNLKLELVRVDEVKEIRDKFPSAFTHEVTDCPEVTDPIENGSVMSPSTTTKSTSTELSTAVRSDIICISDEETDKNSTPASVLTTSAPVTPTPATSTSASSTTSSKKGSPKEKPNLPLSSVLDSKPKINIVNSNILEKINMQDSDSSILRLILKDVTKTLEKPQSKPPPNIELPKNSTIEEGDTSRIQILRNLRGHLNMYRIPVEIQYGEKLKLEYNYSKSSGNKQKRDFWYNLPPKDIQRVVRLPNDSPSVSSNTVPTTKVPAVVPARANIAVNNHQPVVQNLQPVVQNLKPVVQNLQPVVQNLQPVVQNRQPVVQNRQPVVQNRQPVIQGVLQSNPNRQGIRTSEASGSLNTTNAVYTIHNVSQHNTLQSSGNLFLTVQSPMNSVSGQNPSTSNLTSSTNMVLNVVPTMSHHVPVAQSSNVGNGNPILLNATPQKHVVTQYCSNETNFVIASIQGGVPAQNTNVSTQIAKPAANNIYLVTPNSTTSAPPSVSNSVSSGPTYLVVNKNVSKLNNTAQVYNPLSSAILTPLSTPRTQETFTIVQSPAMSSPAVSEVPSSAPSQPVIRVKNLRELS